MAFDDDDFLFDDGNVDDNDDDVDIDVEDDKDDDEDDLFRENFLVDDDDNEPSFSSRPFELRLRFFAVSSSSESQLISFRAAS